MGIDPWAPTDPLGEALHFLRMSGAYYCRSELTAPWGLTLPPMKGYMWFHAVTEGGCWLEAGSEPVLLRPRDFALVPHGEGHVLRSEPEALAPPILDLPLEQVSDRYEILRHGGGGSATTLICGAVRLGHPAALELIELMPSVIHIGDAQADAEAGWLHEALRLMAAEAKALRPGGETVITRLSDVLVVQAIRSWIDRDPAARTGWLGALTDPQIGRAISLVHRDPARPWTVAALADEVAMSRSAFAARFAELVGEPPMSYVTRWRMHVALEWLRQDDHTVAQAASRLGYGSEAAFSRAFRRIVGVPPSSVRAAQAPAFD